MVHERKRILVIEDTDYHILDARSFFAGHPEVDVLYVSSYCDASEELYVHGDADTGLRGTIDGVITDIHFPYSNNEFYAHVETPTGVRVAVELTRLNLPFVLNTDLGHHGAKLEWINGLRQYMNWPLVETGGGADDQNQEADKKNWENAYKILKDLMNPNQKSDEVET